MKTITVIPGDGIGPEIIEAALTILEKFNLNFEIVEAGLSALKKYNKLLPEETLKSIEKNKVVLKGPITTPVGKGFRSVNVELRKRFQLFANVRPAKSIERISKFKNVDIIVIRENLEDLYSGIEFKDNDARELIEFVNKKGFKLREDSNITLKVISRYETERITNFAFALARKQGRKKITLAHKANIMKFTDGLFLEIARNIAEKNPDVAFNDIIIDNLAAQLVMNPEKFDVLLLPNLYGDIISDLCAGLIGSLGLAGSANIGNEFAIFEAVHGSAPDIAGKGIANPTSILLSSVMLLRHINMQDEALKLENAIYETLNKGNLTKDLGGNATTKEFVKQIVGRF